MLNNFSFQSFDTDTRESVVYCLMYKETILFAWAVSFECFCSRRFKNSDDAILFFMGKSESGKLLNLVIPYLMFVIPNPFYNG